MIFRIDTISQKGDATVPYTLYDFTDRGGASVIASWRAGLTSRSRGQLDSKLNLLIASGMDLPPKLIASPIKKTGHVYKLRIHADVMLRPMFCKGPFDMEREFTLLVGAIEIQSRLVPGAEVAAENRKTLLADRKRRVLHV